MEDATPTGKNGRLTTLTTADTGEKSVRVRSYQRKLPNTARGNAVHQKSASKTKQKGLNTDGKIQMDMRNYLGIAYNINKCNINKVKLMKYWNYNNLHD